MSIETVAADLESWSRGLIERFEHTVFLRVTSASPVANAASGVLFENAAELERSIDDSGALFPPLCAVLASACTILGVVPDKRMWQAAIEDVWVEMRTAGEPVRTPALTFKLLLDGALKDVSAMARPPTNALLERTVSFGMKFLLAYAVETPPSGRGDNLDVRALGWLRGAIDQAFDALRQEQTE